ncbi:MAG: TetR/AcrR family transcriptional regulator [Mariprofundaceae bacterium]|nr:TetR/AcrR family transcriptional regulator [Mariprofundaceae bacterium]
MQKSDVQDQIIDAAEKRFSDYGFKKTIMAEIAADCPMSVGNLYRFFKNKESMAAALVNRCLEDKIQQGVDAAANEQGCLNQLNAFLLARLAYAHAHIKDHRHLHELVMIVHKNHADILECMEKKTTAIMAEFLDQGQLSGEFKKVDSERTAYLLHHSLMRYNYPLSLKNNSLTMLQKDLSDFLEMVYTGLRPCDTFVPLKLLKK